MEVHWPSTFVPKLWEILTLRVQSEALLGGLSHTAASVLLRLFISGNGKYAVNNYILQENLRMMFRILSNKW